MEETVEREIILELKCRFFDLISTGGQSLSYSNVLSQMMAALQALLKADEVDLYSCEVWNQGLILEATTRAAGNEIITGKVPDCLLSNIGSGQNTFIVKPAFMPNHDLLFTFKDNEKLTGLLAFKMNSNSPANASDRLLEMISHECGAFIEKVRSLVHTLEEEKRYKQLFRVTEKFHSTMDMDAVLGEIISTLQEVYPSFTYYLLLSHDHKGYGGLPVKDLEYDSENFTAMQSYVSGQIQFEDSVADKNSIMYAPLKGKQGVYGVLQVIAPDSLVFPQNEVEFIKLLANTAGSALENAKLYEQSRKLVADLQLINETSHQLNTSLRLTDTMSFICGQILKSFKAQEVGFIMLDSENDDYTVVQGSTSFFFSKEASEYIFDVGRRVQREMEPLFIGDFVAENGVASLHYRSVMGVPMIQSGELKGFALVMHEEPYHFAFDTFKLLQSLIHHSTLAFTNSILREELEKMVVTDHLTKLYSRGYLDDKMNLSMLEDAQGTFILIDIDNFKGVNDKYGHQVGDDVLIQLARQIAKNIRGTDIGARWGGEELAIYLPGAPLDIGVMIANRLVDKVEKHTNPSVTISCGVSTWIKGQEDTVKSVFKRADQALYLAKNSGKNKVVVQKENQFNFISTQE
ncbi:diguanylate cyclase [Mesobacillus subterraneus]|uniref:sensor domain-containing diguanylate cyclase n=1 Tax=Mesobacillus subterraneus TaxID=285983 RepID=UPI00203FB10F|nr:diguanylate cyclase [Mesobacillus subterraneus]MCM3666029.1 diguanylate cyclase [Mesobacillus subterraneus]MCM3684912.1 diguanylate cyclase [Mesobacillus subterraneus]